MSIRVPADLLYLRPGRSGQWGGGEPQLSDIELLSSIADSTNRLASLRTISYAMTSRAVTVGTTPTLILSAPRDRAYTIINPTAAVGLTTSGIFYPATAISAAGNSQSTPLGVANYDSLHLFVNVSDASGLTLNIVVQVQSPINDTWIDVQDVVPAGITTNGDFYFNLGNFGVTTQFAIRWTITGTCTLSAGYVLKGGLGGSSTGSVNTVFLGDTGVSLQAGYPLLEGQSKDFNVLENGVIYAIASQSVIINVIELM
jgi:hypothetical protein